MRKYLFSLLLLSSSLSAQTLKVCTDQKGRCGYSDMQGNVVVQCKYETAFPFANGVGKVGKGDKYGLVDASGKEILPVKYEEIKEWSTGIYLIKTGSNYGLVSNTGDMLVPAKYSYVSRLNSYGKAWIAAGGSIKKGVISGAKMGMVGSDGKLIIEPKYSRLCEFSPANGRPEMGTKTLSLSDTLETACEYVSCFEGKKNIVFDGHGNAITPLTDKAVYLVPSSGMCAFSIQDGSKVTSGYLDLSTKKNILLSDKESKFKALVCTPFTGNVAKVDNPASRTSYFIDKTGKKISGEFSKTKHKNGYWLAYGKDKSCALLNDDGHFVYEGGKYQDVKLSDVETAGVRLFPVKQNGKWGLADESGKTVVPFDYDDMDNPHNGRIRVAKDKKYGMIDTGGHTVIPLNYIDILTDDTGELNNVWVCKDDSLFYNYDISRKAVMGEGVRVATNFKDGLAWVVPQNQKLEKSTVNSGLRTLYNIKVASRIPLSFGILVDTKGNRRTSIPVPQAMFPVLSQAIADNGGELSKVQEHRLLLTHTRAVRIYPISNKIASGEWDY